jgi:16S rRNA (cytosine967-C5)-methyltransferase
MGAVEEVLGAEGRVDRALKRALRARPGLSRAERAALAEVALGVTANRRRLRWAAGEQAGAAALTFAYLVLMAGVEPVGIEPVELREGLPEGEPERSAVEFSVPEFLVEELRGALGEERARAVLAAFGEPGPVTVRARGDRGEVAAELAEAGVESEPTSRSPWGLRLRGRPNVRGLAAWQRGDLEVQDEGSQVIAALCDARAGERVLDRCAGRGGKSLALWDAMQGAGELVCTDVEAQRLVDLRARAARAGARGLTVGLVGELSLRAASFDLVLLDVPCSETGTLRRSPDLRGRLTASDVDEAVALQRTILDEGAGFVRAGGRLVYATCSVMGAENEAQVARFLEEHPGWTLDEELRLWPDVDGTDGFYVARLTRGAR